MKAFWKLCGYAVLVVSIVVFFYIEFVAEEMFKAWARDMMPFLRHLKHSIQWFVGGWFLWKVIEEVGKLWDKRQQTLDALLMTSQETSEHLSRLRNELAERENDQRKFSW